MRHGLLTENEDERDKFLQHFRDTWLNLLSFFKWQETREGERGDNKNLLLTPSPLRFIIYSTFCSLCLLSRWYSNSELSILSRHGSSHHLWMCDSWSFRIENVRRRRGKRSKCLNSFPLHHQMFFSFRICSLLLSRRILSMDSLDCFQNPSETSQWRGQEPRIVG